MTAMTKLVVAVMVCIAISACVAISANLDHAGYSSEQQLMQKALQLSQSVGRGELSRTDAADELGRLRVRLVGHNAVDDDVFALYRLIAVKRDSGVLDGVKAQQLMRQRLQMWTQRWPRLSPKPSNPAFTAFMLELYGMDKLGR